MHVDQTKIKIPKKGILILVALVGLYNSLGMNACGATVTISRYDVCEIYLLSHLVYVVGWAPFTSHTLRSEPVGSSSNQTKIKIPKKGILILVALVGLEPTLLAELDFESSASTNSATGPWH